MGPQKPGTEFKFRSVLVAWVLSSRLQGTPESLISEHFGNFIFCPSDHRRTLSIEMTVSPACSLSHVFKSVCMPTEKWGAFVCVIDRDPHEHPALEMGLLLGYQRALSRQTHSGNGCNLRTGTTWELLLMGSRHREDLRGDLPFEAGSHCQPSFQAISISCGNHSTAGSSWKKMDSQPFLVLAFCLGQTGI